MLIMKPGVKKHFIQLRFTFLKNIDFVKLVDHKRNGVIVINYIDKIHLLKDLLERVFSQQHQQCMDVI